MYILCLTSDEKIIKLTDFEFVTVQASSPGLPYVNELSTASRKFNERQSRLRTAQKAPSTTKIRNIKGTRTAEEKSLDKSLSNADNYCNTGNPSVSNVVARGRNYQKGYSDKDEIRNRHTMSNSSAERTKKLTNPVTVIEPQTTANTRSNQKDIVASTETSHPSIGGELFNDDYEEFGAPVVNVDVLYSQEKIRSGDSFTESAEITFEGNRSDTESEMCQRESRKLSRKREHANLLEKTVNKKTSITDHQPRSPLKKKSRLYSGSTKRTVKSIATYSDSDTESNTAGNHKKRKMVSSQTNPATKTTEALIVFPNYNTQTTVKSEPKGK